MSRATDRPTVPIRKHPRNKVVDDRRFINHVGGHLVVDAYMHYQMYLITTVLAIAFGPDFLVSNKESKLQNMVNSIMTKNLLLTPNLDGYEGTYTDAYVLDLASDLESLILSNSFDEYLKRRLRSGNDGEIRGAIHEIKVAAGFVRLGYQLTWLHEPSRPEFIAERGSMVYEVEAKRRNRSSQQEFSMRTEMNQVAALLRKALKKKYNHKYIIVIDTDLPPKSLSQNKDYYDTLRGLIDNNLQPDKGIIILNNGYEYQPQEKGKIFNSYLTGRANNGPSSEIMNNLMLEMFSDIAPAISLSWMMPGMKKASRSKE